MTQVCIENVYNKDSAYPMLANFQNGYLSGETNATVLYESWRDKKKSIAVEVGACLYVGNEIQEDYQTIILARNKVTGKARLIEVGNVEFKPVLGIETPKAPLLNTSSLELSRKFGSKKHKQQMEQREKLKINIQTVTEQIQNVTQTITEDVLDISGYNKNDSDDFYVPPINRLADKVEYVYDMDKILSEEDYEKIYSEIENKDDKLELNSWVKQIVENRELSKKERVLAHYASAALKLFLTISREISKKAFEASTVSPTLNKIALANFTTVVNGRRNRSLPYKDKALCHALVFILLINNYKFDLDGLCTAAKLTPLSATTKIKVTGASVINSGSKKIAHLKIPLVTKSLLRRKSAKF